MGVSLISVENKNKNKNNEWHIPQGSASTSAKPTVPTEPSPRLHFTSAVQLFFSNLIQTKGIKNDIRKPVGSGIALFVISMATQGWGLVLV
jgi:hypothetical protein